MQPRRILRPTVLIALCAGALAGHSSAAAEPVRAARAADAPIIDGRLDDAIWTHAQAYPLVLPEDACENGTTTPKFAGTAQFAWDRKYFYVGLRMADDDVVSECKSNGEYAYRIGDLAEVFLKPSGRSWYWELYATPNGYQTTFFWPSGGRRLPGALQTANELVVAAQVQGTINHPEDRDRGWTAEFAIPLFLLQKAGDTFGPGAKWTILVGRYNYSITLDAPELSTLPGLAKTDFHRTKEYASLIIEP
jgi:hypothetical protein